MKANILTLVTALLVLLVGRPNGSAQGTAFTHQGRLTTGGAPVNGTYDLLFTVYDLPTGPGAFAKSKEGSAP